MPVLVTDLTPGDRVMLNCPKARGNQTKRVAQFDGIFGSLDEAMTASGGVCALLTQRDTEAFIAAGGRFAKFLLQTAAESTPILEYPGGGAIRGLPELPAGTQLIAAFVIEPDGSLRDEEGRRIYIEQRLGRAAQG
jgi:hypothetical protein